MKIRTTRNTPQFPKTIDLHVFLLTGKVSRSYIPRPAFKTIARISSSFHLKDKLVYIKDDSAEALILLINIESFEPESLRRYGYCINNYLEESQGNKVQFWQTGKTPGENLYTEILHGILLSRYLMSQKRDKPSISGIRELVFVRYDDKKADPLLKKLKKTASDCAAINKARRLSDLPGNKLTPAVLATEVRRLLSGYEQLRISVFTEKMIGRRMGGFGAVGKGSRERPRLILVEYKCQQKKAPLLALIGKGVTFDSGGISLKPAAKMEQMKHDMSGAAAVIGALIIAAKTKPQLNIIAAIPAAENMPGSTAYKPGDVVTMYNNKTVEIINTDAEGRLMLADTMAYVVKKYKPDYMIDLATLSGSTEVALGDVCTALYTNDEKFYKMLKMAAEQSNDYIWRMPLHAEYRRLLSSKVADMKNVGGRKGGSITAAKFLEEFVSEIPWIHLDIVATAYDVDEKPYYGKGATGVGVQLLGKLFEILSKR